ncbi:hypothetical protein SAMN06265349_101317 [Flavobacterium resistens]|uniref:Uncharacterized protein n=1 Tax=Flavobacterium resistens TaxID=443612 RepID=A0A521AR20_9FLAO|nr:hypothetical protein SAMN06265349_101317 [Flavobacterium resistens]
MDRLFINMDIFAYLNKTKALDAYFFTVYTLKLF